MKENKEDFNMNITISPQWLVFYWVYTRQEKVLGGPIIYTGKNVELYSLKTEGS